MEIKSINSIARSFENYKWKKDTSHKNYCSKKEYNEIAKEFFEELSYELITTGRKVCMPKGLGCFQVCKFKKKGRSIDYAKTRAKHDGENYEKLTKNQRDSVTNIYHTNMGTKGYWVDFFWYAGKHPKNENSRSIANVKSYIFRPSRPNVRPNSYNERNPRVSLFPFFKDKGWKMYSEIKLSI